MTIHRCPDLYLGFMHMYTQLALSPKRCMCKSNFEPGPTHVFLSLIGSLLKGIKKWPILRERYGLLDSQNSIHAEMITEMVITKNGR